MSRSLRALPLFGLFLFLLAPARMRPATAQPAHVQQGNHIVVLGSSTAEGTGPETPDSAWVPHYRRYLQTKNPAHRVTNLARGGYTTYHIRPSGYAAPAARPQPDTARNITRALALHPSALIINLPSNDAARGIPAPEQMANLQAVTDRAAAAGVPVWVATPQPRNFGPEKREIQRKLLDATEARYGSHAIDFWRGLAAEDGTLRPDYDSGDGIHLNSRGHALLFERVRAANIVGAADPQVAAAHRRRKALIDSLLARMTIAEKLGQLAQYSGQWATTGPEATAEQVPLVKAGEVGSFLNVYSADYTCELQRTAVEESRLGIPLLFAYDVVHGFRTVFPMPLAMASSWNPEGLRKAARVSAVEATAAGVHWTFAPMVDVTREPRWGRIMESFGEDPQLASVLARASIKGFQGEDLSKPNTMLATAKHYAAYGGAEAGRDYNTVDISRRTLQEIYLPPFHAAVEEDVASIMAAFNEVGGIPMHAHDDLIDGVLRENWGWGGVLISDYTGVEELIAHGIAGTRMEAGIKALRAGVDIDMVSGIYGTVLPEAVRSGRLSEEEIDEAVRRVLQAKYNAGLFADPYRYCAPDREEEAMLTEEHRRAARKMARQSVVLLKNEDEQLPLSKDLRTVAVIGSLAVDQRSTLGEWAGAGRAEDAVSVLDGIREAVGPNAKVVYAKGVGVRDTSRAGFADAVQAARRADAAVLVLGEDYNMSGEAASRTSLGLPGVQQALAKAVYETGTPTTAVLMNGRPLAVTWLDAHVPSILETWYLGTEMGSAVGDVLFGDHNPSGKLPVSFPRNVGQVPLYYNHKNTGRPPVAGQDYTSRYLDTPWTPLYPFGHGLSYTSFAYSAPTLSDGRLPMQDTLTVSVELTNTGARAGTEIAQLYVQDPVASVTRPVKELRAFRRVALAPGEAQTVRFTLSMDDFAFYGPGMKRIVEPGRFNVFVGGSSEEVHQASFTLTGQTTPCPAMLSR